MPHSPRRMREFFLCATLSINFMVQKDFSKIKTVHFVGIGGIGISAIARMFLMQGKKVSGSDMAESEVTLELRKAGVKISIGQQAENIPTDCDLVIYTIAVLPNNSEFAEAKRRGIPMMSYPEALGEISRDKFTIAVSGTHGKTTTTAMIAQILLDAGLDPSVIVGSFIKSPVRSPVRLSLTGTKGSTLRDEKTNFIAGKGKYFVVEACEYRRSFLNLSPKILVITNIDNDHLDYYKDMDDIESAFAELTTKVSRNGAVVCDFTDKRAKRAASAGKGKVVDFGEYLKEVPKLLVPGVHNRKNAAAALAVSEFLGVTPSTALGAIQKFSGTWRRFEFRGKAKNGTLVYDDYGHHPTEIAATLEGARELFPTQKIVVVFQPHLYSRTKEHLKAFGQCFRLADAVILLPIYPAREIDSGDINSQMVVEEIKRNGENAELVQTFSAAAKHAQNLSDMGDLILTLGAGETNKVADLLVHKVESS